MRCPQCNKEMTEGIWDEYLDFLNNKILLPNLSGYQCVCGEKVPSPESYMKFITKQDELCTMEQKLIDS